MTGDICELEFLPSLRERFLHAPVARGGPLRRRRPAHRAA